MLIVENAEHQNHPQPTIQRQPPEHTHRGCLSPLLLRKPDCVFLCSFLAGVFVDGQGVPTSVRGENPKDPKATPCHFITFHYPKGIKTEILVPFEEKGKVSNQDGMVPPTGRLSQSANIPGVQGIWGIQRCVTPVSTLEDFIVYLKILDRAPSPQLLRFNELITINCLE